MTELTETTTPKPASSSFGFLLLAGWIVLGAALALLAAPPKILTFAFIILGWVLAVAAHEFSHALTAWFAGDHTVAEKGYLSFDPRRYGDLGTSLVIPLLALALGGIGFPGGAVYLRNDLMRSRAWRAAASLAGPAATLVILVALTTLLRGWARFGGAASPLTDALAFLAFLQATALILNLLPIPGLDGFGAIRPFLPDSFAPGLRKIEGLAMLALLGLLFFVPAAASAFFQLAGGLAVGLGVDPQGLQGGWTAFHFWR